MRLLLFEFMEIEGLGLVVDVSTIAEDVLILFVHFLRSHFQF